MLACDDDDDDDDGFSAYHKSQIQKSQTREQSNTDLL